MVLILWKQCSPVLLSALFLLYFPIHTQATLLTRIVHGRLFDIYPPLPVERELKLLQSKKRRSNNLRNCFFSPVQCLLPFDNSRSMESNIKKLVEFSK